MGLNLTNISERDACLMKTIPYIAYESWAITSMGYEIKGFIIKYQLGSELFWMN